MPKTTKKTTAKKAPAKKPVKKIIKAPVAKAAPIAEIPMPDPYCHCTKRKRNTILTCVFTGSFILGAFVAHMLFCDCWRTRAPRMEFVNGCLNVESVKCPKMLEELPMIDADHDGCVTKAEMRATKKAMRHHKGPRAE